VKFVRPRHRRQPSTCGEPFTDDLVVLTLVGPLRLRVSTDARIRADPYILAQMEGCDRAGSLAERSINPLIGGEGKDGNEAIPLDHPIPFCQLHSAQLTHKRQKHPRFVAQFS